MDSRMRVTSLNERRLPDAPASRQKIGQLRNPQLHTGLFIV